MNNKKVISNFEANKIVAEKIIKTIESGDVKEWRKTWTYASNLSELYKLVISGECASLIYQPAPLGEWLNEYPAGFYLTFKDIKKHKLKLKKGSKGLATYQPKGFYKYLTYREKEKLKEKRESDSEFEMRFQKLLKGVIQSLHLEFDYINDKGIAKHFNEAIEIIKGEIVYQRFQYVLTYFFNNNDLVEPVNVKELWRVKDKEIIKENEKIDNVERVAKDYIKRAKLNFENKRQDRAYYQPSAHRVVIPMIDQYGNANEYYQTMMHELAHSTGHESLLKRKGIISCSGFRGSTYAKEELVAELSSTFTMIALKIMTDEILKNTMAYLKSWGEELVKGIRYNILNTIAHSQRATDLILNIKRERI